MTLFNDLPPGPFACLVLDPPWRYGDNLPGPGRGSAKHYGTLSVVELRQLPVPDLAAPDAHLWIWTTNAFLAEGLDLMAGWGFKQKTMLTWCKPQIGMGRYLRNNTEHCLLGVRGRLPSGANNLGSWVLAPRGEHSTKPQIAYDRIAAISPGPRLDMFARQQRPGFEAWGLEAPCSTQ